MKIKENDTVLIISGKDKGKKGKVLVSFPDVGKILVEGVNVRKRHQRPRKQGEKGQIIEKLASISVANAMLICPKCGKPARVASRIVDKKKYRGCKKCSQDI